MFKKYSSVFLALVAAVVARLFLVSIYKVPTDSMAPTFLPGDFILASQISYGLKFPWSDTTWFKSAPRKDDLVVLSFKSKPSVPYVRRVAAVEGDEVETSSGKLKIGPGQIYVLSDNRQVQDDSRDLGLVTIDQIESQAKLIWFSASENKVRWSRLMKAP